MAGKGQHVRVMPVIGRPWEAETLHIGVCDCAYDWGASELMVLMGERPCVRTKALAG